MMVGLAVNVWQGLTAFKNILVVLILMNVLLVKIPFPQMIQKGHTISIHMLLTQNVQMLATQYMQIFTDPKHANVIDPKHANVYGPKTCKC